MVWGFALWFTTRDIDEETPRLVIPWSIFQFLAMSQRLLSGFQSCGSVGVVYIRRVAQDILHGAHRYTARPAWMSDPTIIDILGNGLECQQVQICWQCLCRDESSNQFRKSDRKCVVEACESFKSRCVGGSGIANAHFP